MTGMNRRAVLQLLGSAPLAAGFVIPAGTEADVQTRLKMGQSTNVLAVVKADGKLYSASKETKVTLGGCGG